MTQPQSRELADEPRGSEGTYRSIVDALRGNPAYLLVFVVGLLGGSFGIGTTAFGFIAGDSTLITIGLAGGFFAWTLLLIAALLVIRFVEQRRPDGGPRLPWLDVAARESFYHGPSARELSGRWEVRWYEGYGDQRKEYPGDPKDSIQLATEGCRIRGSAFDPSTELTYFVQGRLSHGNAVTLTYWSRAEMSELSGVVLLELTRELDRERQRRFPVLKG